MARTRGKQPHELFALALHGCLVAKDSAFNTADLIANHTTVAHLAVKQCERELDNLERRIDEEIPAAITRVSEEDARELLAAFRLITDLERVGDLLWGVARHLRPILHRLPGSDAEQLSAMAAVVRKMLENAHQGFSRREAGLAHTVMRADARVDDLCRSIFNRYLLAGEPENPRDAISIVLATQALERAGDHAKNVGEELLHWLERRSVRHRKRRVAEYR